MSIEVISKEHTFKEENKAVYPDYVDSGYEMEAQIS
jgi:hypothetical protein